MTCSGFQQKLKGIDYFKYQPRPRLASGPGRSVRGALGTLLLIAIIVAYIIGTFVKWLTVPPSVSLTQTIVIQEETRMAPMCITLPYITNTSYWSYTFVRQTKDPDTGATLLKTPVNLTMKGEGMNASLCLDPAQQSGAFLRSFCNPGGCDTLKFKLFVCGTPPLPNPAPACVPLSVTTNLLDNYYCTFHLVTDQGTILVETPPKMIWSSKYFVFFQLHEVREQPDLFERWTVTSNFLLEFLSSSYTLQYFFGTGVQPSREVLEVEFRLGPTVTHSNANKMTSLDLVGSWGAFFGVVSGVLTLYFARHNEEAFYKINPIWTRIGSDFKPVDHPQDDSTETSPLLTGGGTPKGAASAPRGKDDPSERL